MAWREEQDILVLLLFAGIAAWSGLFNVPYIGEALSGVFLALVWYYLLPYLEKVGADEMIKKFFVAAFAWTLFAVSVTWLSITLALVGQPLETYVAALKALGYILGWVSGLIGTLLLGIRKLIS